MKELVFKPAHFKLKLKECPPGFFLFENSVGFKSEYGDDVYCDSGERFWGGKTIREETLELVVIPLEYQWVERDS